MTPHGVLKLAASHIEGVADGHRRVLVTGVWLVLLVRAFNGLGAQFGTQAGVVRDHNPFTRQRHFQAHAPAFAVAVVPVREVNEHMQANDGWHERFESRNALPDVGFECGRCLDAAKGDGGFELHDMASGGWGRAVWPLTEIRQLAPVVMNGSKAHAVRARVDVVIMAAIVIEAILWFCQGPAANRLSRMPDGSFDALLRLKRSRGTPTRN